MERPTTTKSAYTPCILRGTYSPLIGRKIRGKRRYERQKRACFDVSSKGFDGHEAIKYTRRRARAVVEEEDGWIGLINGSLSAIRDIALNEIVRCDNLRLRVSDTGRELESGCVYGVQLIGSRDNTSSL